MCLVLSLSIYVLLSFNITVELDTLVSLILQIRKLRYRKVELQRQSVDMSPESVLFTATRLH